METVEQRLSTAEPLMEVGGLFTQWDSGSLLYMYRHIVNYVILMLAALIEALI